MLTFKRIVAVIQLAFSLAILVSGAYGFIRNNYHFRSDAMAYIIGDIDTLFSALIAYWLLKTLPQSQPIVHKNERFF
jgi:hypothetical protein